MRGNLSRRQLFGLAGGIALFGTTTALGKLGQAPPSDLSERTILDGTEHATTVYVRRAEADGPTVMVVGGVHGDETSGYRVANDVRTWSIDAGTLVVLPEANQVAIERDSRYGEFGNLNRHFPPGEEPTTPLARAIWEVVLRYDPDAFIDLHQAMGIYPGDPTGVEEQVGQAIFHSGGAAADLAREVAAYVNENAVPDSRPRYDFGTAHFDYGKDPSGLLAAKVALDLPAQSFLVEVTSQDLDLETRVRWERLIVRRFLVEEGLLGAGTADERREEKTTRSVDEPPETETELPAEEPPETETTESVDDPPETKTTPTPEENEPPKAVITTTPADAETIDFERGDAIALSGSASSDADGEIVSYEWDVDDDGTFERTGATVNVTLTSCGSYPVTLRVTDDDGATVTDTVTLATVRPQG